MIFHDPLALLLMIPLLLLITFVWRSKTHTRIMFPATSLLTDLPLPFRCRCAVWLPSLRCIAMVLAVIALARPQLPVKEATVVSRGVDLALALDISTSMLAIDRTPQVHGRSRLQIAREVTRSFISRRTGDRIGVIAFAARPYPVAPLTLDHTWLNSALDQLEIGAIEDGTALGDGVLAALNRLRSSPAASRAVVLLTDGRNNAGNASPDQAAQAARSLGIRVHTIGIGGEGAADFPVENPLGGVTYRQVAADLDEAALKQIAQTTGGTFFRAADATTLQAVFSEIDRLERRPIEEKVSTSFRELFPPFLLTALTLLVFDTILRATWLRRVP
jgi:Ca-activated chloride channel family protein